MAAMDSRRRLDDLVDEHGNDNSVDQNLQCLEAPAWLVSPSPTCMERDVALRYEMRQRITRLTFNQYRSPLQTLPSNLRPRAPSAKEAQALSKRGWEARFHIWRKSLRELCQDHGLDHIDDSLDSLTVDLQRELDREASVTLQSSTKHQ